MKKGLAMKTLVVGQLQSNCYLIWDTDSLEALIVDPGDNGDYIATVIQDLRLRPTQIIATHGHFDHILAAFELQRAFQIPFLIDKQDVFLLKRMRATAGHFLGYQVTDPPPEPTRYLNDFRSIQIGTCNITVIPTPGHTPGSISLYAKEQKWLFTGDTIFADGGVGRTDFPYASTTDLAQSIKKIFKLPENVRLYPGHGRESTIKAEKRLQKFAV